MRNNTEKNCDEKNGTPILDKYINKSNYAVFSQCNVVRNGSAVRFKYPSSDVYEVDIGPILSWFDKPHYICTEKGIADWPQGRSYKSTSRLYVKAVRRVLCKSALRIYMSDNTAYDVAWDTVLMACEPRYEWFGGLPEEIKAKM